MWSPVRVALCLAVVLAGCGSGAGGQEAGGTTATTVTPAPVPTDGAPVAREAVDGDRLVPLAERHEATLAGRSFTALGRQVVTGPVGVLLDVRWERRVAADRERYHAVRSETATWGWDGREPVDRRYRYYERERTLTRHETGGEVRYGVAAAPGTGGPVADFDGGDRLGELFGAFETWRVVRYSNGSLALSGRGLERPGAIVGSAPLSDPRNATAEVRVEPGGRVARFAVRFEATSDGMPASVVEVRRYVAVGTTVIDRPPWYGAAVRTATPTANATAER